MRVIVTGGSGRAGGHTVRDPVSAGDVGVRRLGRKPKHAWRDG